ncbi:collagenase [Vibrio ostreicida]|uniref:collagenase n=1 Tax=Vibrio ostreicida TaxID=526588 RepID=UPI00097056BE|nr:collagenase [Vibrio ostreicida]
MKLNIPPGAVARVLISASVLFIGQTLASNVPVPQVIERHHEHNDERVHGIENLPLDYQPTQLTVTFPHTEEQPSALSRQCDLEALSTSDSKRLISELISQGAGCINGLFSAQSSIQEVAFSSNNMRDVANYTAQQAKHYQGNGNDGLEALYLYLRAGFYAAFYNDNITLAAWVKPAVQASIDEFVASPHFYNNSDAHGKVLTEVMITMDSAGLQHAYLEEVTQWLKRWDANYAQSWYMRSAVNSVFTILYGGSWNEQYVDIIGQQSELVKALSRFVRSGDSIGRDDEFMTANAGRELGRLTQYKNVAISGRVKTALGQLFEQYEMYGFGDAVWLGAAYTASYYSDCAEYRICNFGQQLKPLVLAQSYSCSPSVRILSQAMTTAQHQAACDKMGYEDGDFHQRLETGNQPVADDHNTQLQVNIFDSSDAYSKYAGPIFGIDTNNGGMYLEGDPSKPDNVPNFIAYEADYANPDHYVWNLEHEYVHYLDGRFDMYGDFNHPTEKVVWWSEGIAEYIAQQDNNQEAIDTIIDGSTYTLDEVFETTYEGFDVDRIYRWGYLAVRFMFERHKAEINQMLTMTRKGNWAQYKVRVDSWSLAYQDEFEQWQQQLVDDANQTPPTAVIKFNNPGKTGESIFFSSEGSSDQDGQISAYYWEFGDGVSSTEANTAHQYHRSGDYSVRLTVTDNDGLTAQTISVLTIEEKNRPPLPNDCAVRDTINGGRLEPGTAQCLAAQSPIWLSVAGVNQPSTIALTSANGTGDLKVEYSNSGWPNELGTNVDGWSDNPGNAECIRLSQQTGYWGYIKISGDFNHAAIVVDFDEPSCREP